MPEKDFTVNYRGNDAGFGSTTRRVTEQLRTLGGEAKGLAGKELMGLQQRLAGIFTVGFLENKIMEAIEFADSMRSLSDMTRIGVESLQELEYAAKQAGTPFQSIIDAIRNLERSRVSALSGNKSDLASFERLGISMEDMKTLSAEQMFRQISASIHQGNYSAQQLNDSLNIMGRSASQLFPLFNAGLQELSERAREAGVVLKESLINTLDEAGDQIDEAKGRFRLGFAMAGAAAATAWNKAATALELYMNFRTAFAIGKGESEARFIRNLGGMPLSAATLTYAFDLADSVKQAAVSAQGDWDKLLGRKQGDNSSKGAATDQVEFAVERAQRAADLKAKNDEKARENMFKSMGVEERLNSLLKERLGLVEALAKATDDLAREEVRTKLLDIESKISDASSLKTQAPPNSQLQSRNLDELSRSGFFTSGRPSELADLSREQIKAIRDVMRSVDRIPVELDARLG